MKIILPNQITSEIRKVINESEDYLILVSPYVNFINWDEIKIDIINCLKRNVKINFYSRMEYENFKSWEYIESLGIQPKLVKNLHAKMYFSEKSGIVTSMNLLSSSNLNALEFGCIYNLKEELEELKFFTKDILEPNVIDKPNEEELYFAKEKFITVLRNFLSSNFNRSVSCRFKNNHIEFNINNQFYLYLDKVTNNINISGIISGLEYENFSLFKSENQRNKITYELNESSISANLDVSLSNSNFDFLRINEKKMVLEFCSNFVNDILDFKKECYGRKMASR